jgi:hypothetical protein
MPQFGVALSASRPATTAQFTGLNRATDRIQPGTRFWAMNTDDRNVSGRITKLTAAMTVSSLRTTAASAVDSDANAAPSRTEHATSTTSPRSSGYRAPSASPSDTRMADWITATRPSWTRRPPISAPRLTGVTRNRSITPLSRSQIRPMPAHPPENRTVITTIPGVRKSMYEPAPKPGIWTIRLNSCP